MGSSEAVARIGCSLNPKRRAGQRAASLGGLVAHPRMRALRLLAAHVAGHSTLAWGTLEINVAGWLVAQPFRTRTECLDSTVVFVGMADRSIPNAAADKWHLFWEAACSPWNSCAVAGPCTGGLLHELFLHGWRNNEVRNPALTLDRPKCNPPSASNLGQNFPLEARPKHFLKRATSCS